MAWQKGAVIKEPIIMQKIKKLLMWEWRLSVVISSAHTVVYKLQDDLEKNYPQVKEYKICSNCSSKEHLHWMQKCHTEMRDLQRIPPDPRHEMPWKEEYL